MPQSCASTLVIDYLHSNKYIVSECDDIHSKYTHPRVDSPIEAQIPSTFYLRTVVSSATYLRHKNIPYPINSKADKTPPISEIHTTRG